MSEDRKTAPFQIPRKYRDSSAPVIPWDMHMRAYEVYAHVHGSQKALTKGECRGGFGVGELFAFLYAGQFPREEWTERVNRAINQIRY